MIADKEMDFSVEPVESGFDGSAVRFRSTLLEVG